jgi:hypothetical protein
VPIFSTKGGFPPIRWNIGLLYLYFYGWYARQGIKYNPVLGYIIKPTVLA